MSLTKNDILGIGIILGFVGTISYAIDCSRKLKAVSDKMDIAVRDLVKADNIDIPKELIEKSVEKAVKDEAQFQVARAMTNVANKVVEEYRDDIETAVENEFEKQKGSLAKALKTKIDDIDISKLKREVVREAKEDCANKLKRDLEDISDKYTEQIDSMTSIYQTIASKIESIGD